MNIYDEQYLYTDSEPINESVYTQGLVHSIEETDVLYVHDNTSKHLNNYIIIRNKEEAHKYKEWCAVNEKEITLDSYYEYKNWV